MRWLLLAALLSLLIHGLFFIVHFDWLKEKRILPPKTRTVAVALSYKKPDKVPAIQKIQPIPIPPVVPKPLPRKIKETPPVMEKDLSKPVMAPPEPEPAVEPEEPMSRADQQPAPKNISDDSPGKEASTAHMLKEATPLYKDNPPPSYPRIARRRGHQGVVILEVLVSQTGKVRDLRIYQSSGYTSLDEAAKASVVNWLFVPGMKGDQPMEMWVTLPVQFQLK